MTRTRGVQGTLDCSCVLCAANGSTEITDNGFSLRANLGISSSSVTLITSTAPSSGTAQLGNIDVGSGGISIDSATGVFTTASAESDATGLIVIDIMKNTEVASRGIALIRARQKSACRGNRQGLSLEIWNRLGCKAKSMSELAEYDITVDSRFTLRETSAITDIHMVSLTKMINSKTFPRTVYSTKKGETSFKAVGLPVVLCVKIHAESIADGNFKLTTLRQLLEFTDSNWDSIGRDSSRIAELWTWESLEKDFIAYLFSEFIKSVVKLEWAKGKVVVDPDIRGGIPTIRGTRIGVYEAADYMKNEGMESCLGAFPVLGKQDLEAAEIYARALPMEHPPAPGRGLLAQLEKEGKLRLTRQELISVSD